MKVLFLTNIPSPYMIGYLNELGKYCELVVAFEKEYDATRPESWKHLLRDANFKYIILKGKSISKKIYKDKMDSAPDDKALSFEIIKYINNQYDFIIVANPCTPTGIIAILYMQWKKIGYLIQSEGGYPGSGKGFKEKLKFLLMSKAEYYFSTCEMDDAYFIQYGATKERIRRYPFASIGKKDLPNRPLRDSQKKEYKQMLNIDEKIMILSVGRSVYVKGFDILLYALKDISSEIAVYFVGGECTAEYKEIIDCLQLQNVHFVDNVEYSELKKYYCAADIFVLPTRSDTWGLVINEAMTYGLPVITTDRCVAGDALIENGTNGYIVESENFKQLEYVLRFLIYDKEKRDQFGRINYIKMRDWTFENMGKVMFEHLQTIAEQETK